MAAKDGSDTLFECRLGGISTGDVGLMAVAAWALFVLAPNTGGLDILLFFVETHSSSGSGRRTDLEFGCFKPFIFPIELFLSGIVLGLA